MIEVVKVHQIQKMEEESNLVMVEKHKRQQPDHEGDDRLSALPDDLLYHIISDTFLSATMSILSRRWRHLWISNPCLFFSDDFPSRGHFISSVDRALDRYVCDGPLPMNEFHLRITDASNADHLNSWVHFAVQCKVQVLLLEASCKCNQPLELPLWESVTKISLEYGSLIEFRHLPPPCSTFSSLKFMTLKGVRFSSDGCSLGDILSSHCPRLQWLNITKAYGLKDLKLIHPELTFLCINMRGPCMQELIVSAEKLTTLGTSVLFRMSSKCIFKISAPNLKAFAWIGFIPPLPVPGKFPSLEKADLNLLAHCDPNMKELCRQSTRMSFMSLIYVQNLRVHLSYWADSTCGDYLDETTPTFHNVKSLEAAFSNVDAFGETSFNLLRSCARIEDLRVVIKNNTSEKGVANSPKCSCNLNQCWRTQPLSLNSLKRIVIQGFQGQQHEADFVKLLLERATILDQLIIYIRRRVASACRNTAKELLEFPRTSSGAIVSFRT